MHNVIARESRTCRSLAKMWFLRLALLLGSVQACLSWDQDELDLFDLVEEVGQSFYEVLHVEESASSGDIRKAYRQLSLQLHPDKSDDPDAAEKFRKLVDVSEVLKDDLRRARYDLILREGLPDWRQPVYYYRRVKKMGLLELCILLLVIASVGQYLFGWAVWVEKQLVLQEVLQRREKREKKSKQSSQRLDAEVEFRTAQVNASIPRLRTLLPCILAKKLLELGIVCWSFYCQWRATRAEKAQQQEATGITCNGTVSVPDESPSVVNYSKKAKGKRERSVVARKTFDHSASQRKDLENTSSDAASMLTSDKANSSVPSDTRRSSSLQNVTVNNRDATAPEDECKPMSSSQHGSSTCTHRDSKQSNIQQEGNPSTGSTNAKDTVSAPPPVVLAVSSTSWGQYQQRQLEWALAQYPKFSEERWDNIARAVPGKSKAECIERCKKLSEVVRKRKSAVTMSS